MQTSPSTVDSTPGVNEARIGTNGSARGLVIEEQRTCNVVPWSRNLAGVPVIYPGTTLTPDYAAGPDLANLAGRVQIAPNEVSSADLGYQQTAEWDTITYSEWIRSPAARRSPAGPSCSGERATTTTTRFGPIPR